MSTDIVQWPEGKKVYQQDALYVWLYLSLPFMVATLGLWGGFHLYAQHKENRNEELWDNSRERYPV